MRQSSVLLLAANFLWSFHGYAWLAVCIAPAFDYMGPVRGLLYSRFVAGVDGAASVVYTVPLPGRYTVCF